MSGQAEVSVTPAGDGSYRVLVKAGDLATAHDVEVPAALAEQLGWSAESEPELVRQSFLFLLEREGPSSILGAFNLEVISRYFPEYPDEIRRRRP